MATSTLFDQEKGHAFSAMSEAAPVIAQLTSSTSATEAIQLNNRAIQTLRGAGKLYQKGKKVEAYKRFIRLV